jgi:polysaccharide biosynthesis/export protein
MIDTARLSKFFCKVLLLGLSLTPLFAVLGLPTAASAKPRVLPKPSKVAPSQQRQQNNNQANFYTLGPGDRVRIDVFNVPEYSGEFVVLVDGTLNLPIVGAISVNGGTLDQVSKRIGKAYERYVRVPTVTVGLILARPIQVTIAGEVNRAGSYSIPLAETRKFPTLSQALQLAGGVKQTSNLRRVRVVRGNREGYFDMLAVLQGSQGTGQDFTLRDGDAIYVPAATTVSASDISQIAESNIGSQDNSIKVTVAGEVNRAGAYSIPLSNTPTETRKFPTLSQAVQLAGGVNQTSDLRRVRLSRGTSTIAFNLLAVLQGTNKDITLRDGDTIFVPTAINASASDISRVADSNIGTQDTAIKIAIIGEVSKPGTYSLRADGAGATGAAGANGSRLSIPTLTEALRLAGGSTASADASRIVVKRLTRNGSPQVIRVNLLSLLNAGDTSQDLPLQNGDTIYLPTDPVIGSVGSRQLAASSFGPQVLNPIKVAVVGQVNRPGSYNVRGDSNATGSTAIQNVNFSAPTVTQAIQAAGGIKPTADVRRISLRRFNRDAAGQSGRGSSKEINLWALLTQGDVRQDVALQEGDQIFIPEVPAGVTNPAETDILANAPFAPGLIRVNVVGEIKGSRQGGATIELPPTSTLNQAILAAGGFDTVRANKNSVDLIRLNPNGSVTKRTIGVDFARGVDETGNPTLRNNDIVVVGRSGTTRVGDGLGSILNPLSPLFSIFNLFRR